jgi:hypothetical protein
MLATKCPQGFNTRMMRICEIAEKRERSREKAGEKEGYFSFRTMLL